MCALDEVQVTFACIGHPSGTTVTIIIQVYPDSPLHCSGPAQQRCLLRLQTCKGRKVWEFCNWWCHSTSTKTTQGALLSATACCLCATVTACNSVIIARHCVQCGWLLTIANLGDSRAVLDTGAQILQLSVDHRVATHRAERHRLERTGALIAPIDVSGKPSPLPQACMTRLLLHHGTPIAPINVSGQPSLLSRACMTRLLLHYGALIPPLTSLVSPRCCPEHASPVRHTAMHVCLQVCISFFGAKAHC